MKECGLWFAGLRQERVILSGLLSVWVAAFPEGRAREEMNALICLPVDTARERMDTTGDSVVSQGAKQPFARSANPRSIFVSI